MAFSRGYGAFLECLEWLVGLGEKRPGHMQNLGSFLGL
jgi:hypothetical protein